MNSVCPSLFLTEKGRNTKRYVRYIKQSYITCKEIHRCEMGWLQITPQFSFCLMKNSNEWYHNTKILVQAAF